MLQYLIMEFEIKTTADFIDWQTNLKDMKTKSVIDMHIKRMRFGNLGDVKDVGGSVLEKRIFYGAGYRLYFVRRGRSVILLLCGGDKSTQGKDIERAQQMAKELA
jgi:putative addiction module killer protein